MRFIKETNIDFLGMSRIGFMISSAFIIAGLISLIAHGGPRLSIDFEGGTIIQIKFNEEAQTSKIRKSLESIGINKSEIQTFGDPNEVLIRLKKSRDTETLTKDISEAFNNYLPNEEPDFRRVETVGPKIGAELSGKAFFTILSAIIGILIYISARFEFKFAIAAIAALIHDVVITLGIFSFMNFEISLSIIAAFLTIVGYSLNDTIVVFDRIRENIKKLKQDSYIQVINKSINESLSRTAITSLTTFIVVFILWAFGGEVIKFFAFAMMVGVIVGTYSSIYIASPVVVALQEKFNKSSK